MKSAVLYSVLISILLIVCTFLFVSKERTCLSQTHIGTRSTKHYKYEIYTPEATYFADSLVKGTDGQVGFYNSNGTYVQIKQCHN